MEINDKNYQINDKLGEGTYGIVYKAIRTSDKNPFAIKIITINNRNQKNVMNEINYLKLISCKQTPVDIEKVCSEINNRLDAQSIIKKNQCDSFKVRTTCTSNNKNKNIIAYEDHEMVKDGGNNYLYLVQEYCEGGNLLDYISNNKKTALSVIAKLRRKDQPIVGNSTPDNYISSLNPCDYFMSETDTLMIMDQLLQGIYFIHYVGLIHCDLKPENILLKNRDDKTNLRICDFGLSQGIDPYSKEVGGSYAYLAPEKYHGNITDKCDMFSLGCIMFECLFGVRLIEFDSTHSNPGQSKLIDYLIAKQEKNFKPPYDFITIKTKIKDNIVDSLSYEITRHQETTLPLSPSMK